MSNKDINNEDTQQNISDLDLSMKENMHLFSYSLLKSKTKRTLSPYYNSFRYYFTDKDNHEFKFMKQKNSNHNRKISLIEGDNNNSSLKTLNIEVPTNEKLLNDKFKNEFLNEYDNSFAYYCGINKNQFTDLYINNQYIPIIDEFGDINISIKSIIDLLKTYSMREKAGKKILKRNRIKKIFKTQIKKINSDKMEKNKFIFKVSNIIETNNELNCKEIRRVNDNKNNKKNLNDKFDDTKRENYKEISNLITIENNNKFHGNKFGINSNKYSSLRDKGKNLSVLIPKKSTGQKPPLSKISGFPINTSSLSISNIIPKSNLNIPSSNLMFNYNTLTNEENKKYISNNINPTPFGLGISSIPPIQDSKQRNLSPSNNIIFDFNKNNIQKMQNLSYATPGVNGNNINISANMNTNALNYNNSIISPRYLFNNNFDLFSPYSPFLQGSNYSSPRVISPSFNNNVFQDGFIYNNINNGNSFYFGNNSPMTINNNNIINNNIINNNNSNINDMNNNGNMNNNKMNINNINNKNNIKNSSNNFMNTKATT